MNPPTRRGLHLTSLLESTNCEKYLVGDCLLVLFSLEDHKLHAGKEACR